MAVPVVTAVALAAVGLVALVLHGFSRTTIKEWVYLGAVVVLIMVAVAH